MGLLFFFFFDIGFSCFCEFSCLRFAKDSFIAVLCKEKEKKNVIGGYLAMESFSMFGKG